MSSEKIKKCENNHSNTIVNIKTRHVMTFILYKNILLYNQVLLIFRNALFNRLKYTYYCTILKMGKLLTLIQKRVILDDYKKDNSHLPI